MRPTSDRVREAWLSIVSPEIPGAVVLDLFAGTGALGLEALSRGAASTHFVENAQKSLSVIRANIDAFQAGERAVLHRADALRFIRDLAPHTYGVAFADPPYDHGLATRVAERWLASPFASLLGIEHRQDEVLPGSDDRRKYGDTVLTFYRADAPGSVFATFSGTDEPAS